MTNQIKIKQTWETVIGLEIHVQLNTATKLFCSCSTNFGSAANQNTCPYCQGHPGVLPVLNREALHKAISLGLAINAQVNHYSQFERKNYFYPDNPKAYQISQLKSPICSGGFVEINLSNAKEGGGDNLDAKVKKVGIDRIQLEEDAGKLMHSEVSSLKESYVDLNRAGTALIELVSKPDLSSADEAVAYFQTLRNLFLYLGISDCNMQEGSLRCDANVSIRPLGDKIFGTRTEIKNMNTFKGIQAAINYEVKRQIALKEAGGEVVQETLLFDPLEQKTRSMRSKEEAQDYRYFMDPDLIPVRVSDEEIDSIRKKLPELPQDKFLRFKETYKLSNYDTWLLTEDKYLADYFEQAVKVVPDQPKKICNWIATEVLSYLNQKLLTIEEFPIPAKHIGELVLLIQKGEVTGKIAKDIFQAMLTSKESPEVIVAKKGLKVENDEGKVTEIVESVINNNSDAVAKYREGNTKVFGFFVGQVMKESKGQANPELVNSLLKKHLG